MTLLLKLNNMWIHYSFTYIRLSHNITKKQKSELTYDNNCFFLVSHFPFKIIFRNNYSNVDAFLHIENNAVNCSLVFNTLPELFNWQLFQENQENKRNHSIEALTIINFFMNNIFDLPPINYM